MFLFPHSVELQMLDDNDDISDGSCKLSNFF